MKTIRSISRLFLIAALYDGLLGLMFLLTPSLVFQHFNVPPPNHPGYIQFPAALLVVFALMFLAIARDPRANKNLILYGILLKVSYCGVVLFNWLTVGVSWIWKPFVFFDVIFLILFLLAQQALPRRGAD